MPRHLIRLVLFATVFAFSCQGFAADINVSNDAELSTALNNAVSGDRILLAAGQYNRFSRTGLSGITLRSADPKNLAVISAGGNGEVMHLSSVTNITIEHLIFEEFSTNGINIDDSGNWPTGKSSGIILRDITVRNANAVSGNRDAIKISGVDNFLIDRVQVINWSSGGSAIDPVGSHNGVISNSRFVHNGPTASAIRPKGGSSNIDIIGNYLEMTGGRAIQFGGSTGASLFRFLPGESNYEADNIRAAGNIVTGAESAFSWVNIDGGIARHNFVDRPTTWVMRILNENQGNSIVDTQNGVFSDNIIQFDIAPNRVVNIGPEVLAGTFTFQRNQWYDFDDPGLTEADLQLPAVELGGIYGVNPQLNVSDAITFETEWGLWGVNPHLTDQLLTISDFQRYSVAMAGSGASFDPLASNPFIGNWNFTPLTNANIQINAQSQLLLSVTAVPEPSFAGVLFLGTCIVLPRRGKRIPV